MQPIDGRDHYLSELKSLVEVAPAALSPETLGAVSIPNILYLDATYWESAVRIMVMGQETRDVSDPLTRLSDRGNHWFDYFIAAQNDDFKSFDWSYDLPHRFGPFWKAYQEIVEAFALPSRRATAWSNIWKVQLLHERKGRQSVQAMLPAQRMEIARWQQAVFKAEIEYARPHIIMMMTGDCTWLGTHMFDSNPIGGKSDVRWGKIDDLPAASHGHVVAPYLERQGIVAAFSNHPNSRHKDRHIRRNKVLEWLRHANRK